VCNNRAEAEIVVAVGADDASKPEQRALHLAGTTHMTDRPAGATRIGWGHEHLLESGAMLLTLSDS
jgi:hypothetical protein